MCFKFKTLEEACEEIRSEYDSYFGDCAEEVPEGLRERTEEKLIAPELTQFGFTEDRLTVELGDVDVADDYGINKLADKLRRYVFINESSSERYVQLVDRIKRDKLRPIEFDSVQNNPLTRGLPYTSLWTLIDHNELPTNAVSKYFGKKVSKVIKDLVPELSDEYALALSSRKTLKLYVTIDPYLMVNASERATFSSCYTFDGEYHYSTHSWIGTPNAVMVCAFDEEDHIQYRFWSIIRHAKTAKAVSIFTSYSHMRTDIIDEKVHNMYLSSILGEGYARIPNGRVSSSVAYLDSFKTYTEGGHEGTVDVPIVRMPYAIEIFTGGVADYGQVEGNECEDCGARGPVDDMYYVDGHGNVCSHCIGDYTWLDGRDSYVHDDYIVRNVHEHPFHEDDIGDNHIEVNGEWYPEDEAGIDAHGDPFVFDDDTHVYCEASWEYYPVDECVQIGSRGYWYAKEEVYEADDGTWFVDEGDRDAYNEELQEEVV